VEGVSCLKEVMCVSFELMKLKHYQTVLFEDILQELKKKAGTKSTEEALRKAVYHYLTCEHTDEY